MKNFILVTILIISSTLFSFTLPGEESIYDGNHVGYNVERSQGVVLINLILKDPSKFQEINILRSDKPTENYRNIKSLDPSQVAELNIDNVIIDKYPLPGSINAYYKIQTIEKSGVQRTFPMVVLSK